MPIEVTTKLRSIPSLLRLTWNGYPMKFEESKGWGCIGIIEKKQKTLKTIKKNGNVTDEVGFIKIPHKVSQNQKVICFCW